MTPSGHVRTATPLPSKQEDRVFKALANETRRTILMMLHDQGKASMTSSEIADSFKIEWQAISRHLAVLTEAGLITRDVRGRTHAYALVDGQVRRTAGRWIETLSQTGTWNAEENKMVFPPLPDD